MFDIDVVVRGRRIIVGFNTEQKRWAIKRERLFTALLWWPLIIGIGRRKEDHIGTRSAH